MNKLPCQTSRWIVCLLAALLIAGPLNSCRSGGVIQPGPELAVSVAVPADLRGGEDALWRVSATGGTTPYTLSLDLGGGAWEEAPSDLEFNGDYCGEFRMINQSITDPELYIYIATVTDAEGHEASASDYYTIAPLIPLLEIDEITPPNDSFVSVSVRTNSPHFPTAEVTITGGIESPRAVLEGHYNEDWTFIHEPEPCETYVYDFTVLYFAMDVLDGSSGKVTFIVKDDWGQVISEEVEVTAPGRYQLPFHSLAAIPLDKYVSVDESARVVIACGDFPADAPFQYACGLGLTVEEGAECDEESQDFGAPSSGRIHYDFDGLWAHMNPTPDSFLVTNEYMIQPDDIGGGRVRFDFNVVPIGGSNTQTGGILFSVALNFDSPGKYTLGFEEFRDLKRTYYKDTDSNEYYWADISNDYHGVPNTITVTGP